MTSITLNQNDMFVTIFILVENGRVGGTVRVVHNKRSVSSQRRRRWGHPGNSKYMRNYMVFLKKVAALVLGIF